MKDLPAPIGASRDGALGAQFDSWVRARELEGVDASLARRAVSLWARMHGLVSLEIDGNFASMGLNGQSFYAAELEELVSSYGP